MKNPQEILGPDRARVGPNRLRIFAGPQWVRPDQQAWVAIGEAVRVVPLDGGGYALTYGGMGIQLVPDARDKAAVMEATKPPDVHRDIERGHFGPILDAAKAPDILRWNVVVPTSVGIKRGQDAWIIPDESGDGVKLGLFLRDWQGRFGDRCAIAKGVWGADFCP